MKIIAIAAVTIAATFSYAAPAFAHSANSGGHYEWRSGPAYGPRAPTPAPRRVWVSDAPQSANCDCDMMKMGGDGARDCMKAMHAMASPTSARSAS